MENDLLKPAESHEVRYRVSFRKLSEIDVHVSRTLNILRLLPLNFAVGRPFSTAS